jgi:hypothetical protein
MGSTNSCLLLCDRWTHCVREQGACQLEWVCKISENVQNFFFSFSTQSFSLLPVSVVLKNVPLCTA